MTTFAEMEALVLAQTRRPELPEVTKAAVRTATLRAHHIDFFRRDLTQARLNYTVLPDAYFYDFPDSSSTLLRLRTIKNVYSVTELGQQVEQLEYRESDDLYDNDGDPRRYLYTIIGDTLRCYPDMPTGKLDVYYFQNPDVRTATYSSWIANTYPDDLAMWAAAIVFARSGFAEMANDFQRTYVQPFKEMLLASHLLGTVS